jgi:hypothetical protein
MKHSLRALSLLPCVALLLAVAPTAHAQISATVYEGIPDPGNAGDITNNETAAKATFTISGLGIDFQSELTSYTNITAFLNNPTYLTQSGTFNPSGSVDNIELVITGTTYLAAGSNSFDVSHDDGVVLTMAGIGTGTFGNIVDAPGPTSFSVTPFTVTAPTAGNYSFVLDYSECCGAPADLEWTVNGSPVASGTPEPSSLVLMGTGMLAFAGAVRRRLFA